MAGYSGQDSMRENAERMLAMNDKGPRESSAVKLSRSAEGLGNVGSERPYARGGKVARKEPDHHENRVFHTDHHHGKKIHPLTRTQTDMHLPKHLSSAGACLKPSKAKKVEAELHMPKSRSKGGALNVESMKGLERMGKAMGGTVYERDMVGMHPSSTPRRINYEAQERGNHPIRKAYRKGGHCYVDGGEVSGQSTPVQQAPQPMQQQYGPVDATQKPYAMGFNGRSTPGTALKKGGRAKRAEGGKMEMRPMMRKEGGDTKKYACGGVAKLRLGEMNSKGMPLKSSRNPGLSTNILPNLSKRKSAGAILRTH